MRFGKPFAIALFDLDNLKEINDTFGHASGDAVLKAVAREMTANLRKTDLTARVGGDEFLVIFLETEEEEAWNTAERLRIRISGLEFIKLAGQPCQVTISGGVTAWQEKDSSDEILRRVNDLLYKAKKTGKDRIIQNQA